MKRLEPKHPRTIRWFHWINVPLLVGMVWSGLLIYWANDVYRIGWGGFTLFHFFPDWFYRALNLQFRLAEGMAWHFFLWFFAINGVLYVTYTFASGEWRQLLPNRRSFREAVQVVLHDLKLAKSLPPQDKFNAAQRIAYTGVVLMGAVPWQPASRFTSPCNSPGSRGCSGATRRPALSISCWSLVMCCSWSSISPR